MSHYFILVLLVTFAIFDTDAYPTSSKVTTLGAYNDDRYDPYEQENEYEGRNYNYNYKPYNTFGKMVIRNNNLNDNLNTEANENENNMDNANANDQEQLRLRTNSRYNIRRPAGYKSEEHSDMYNTDTDDDTTDTDSDTDSDGSDSDSAAEMNY